MAGIFIREHVLSVAMGRHVQVVHMEVVKGPWRWPDTMVRTTIEDGITIHRVIIATPVRRFRMAERLVRMAYNDLLEKMARKDPIDILHIHVRTEVTEQVMPIARKFGLPVVVTEHNTFYHIGIKELPIARQKKQVASIRKWFADPFIAAVMPVSHDLARVLEKDYEVPWEKLVVVPNIAADVFQPPQERSTPPPFRILLAAIWRDNKDHGTFISALRSLPREIRQLYRITWCGSGPDMATIKEICAKELPDMPIGFLGQLDKSQLAREMQQCQVFVLPTVAENLPCVVLESLCCGTPVISMEVNGLPELVNDSNGMLVPPRDPLALAEALERCRTRYHQYDHELIAQAALGLYSEQAVALQIEQVYTRVLKP